MKIYRGGENNEAWASTDEKTPAWIKSYWHPDRSFILSGAVNKSAQRRTAIGVRLDEADIVALHEALLDHYAKRSEERDRLESRVHELESALLEMYWLTAFNSDLSPTELLAEIGKIARHCSRRSPAAYKSRRKWVRERWNP